MSDHHPHPGAVVHPVLPAAVHRPWVFGVLAALLAAWLVVGSIVG